MATYFDCAILSEDVYNRQSNEVANSFLWERIDSQNWGGGFAAGLYVKGNATVVAFRGTDSDDLNDWWADAQMLPLSDTSRTMQIPHSLLQEYRVDDAVLDVGGLVLGRFLASDWSRNVINNYCNRIPARQSRQAVEYFRSASPKPELVVGHSLGGALAKIVSYQMNVKAVAFNSPFMGALEGIEQSSTPDITNINAMGDPLSTATAAAGNNSHGAIIRVRTPRFPGSVPEAPQIDRYQRPIRCPRGGYGYTPEALARSLAGAICENVMDSLVDPVARRISAPVRGLELLRRYPAYYSSLMSYLGRAAGYYHNMSNLLNAMEGRGRFGGEIR